ncbi:MAG: nucleotidyltransferase domain-containing protein [Syntrophales bacterium]
MDAKDLAMAIRFKELVTSKITVNGVMVFGSRARGDSVKESDLDILVTVTHFNQEIEDYISDCAWETGFPEDVVIVPIVVEQHAIEDGPLRESSFIRTVQKEGIRI